MVVVLFNPYLREKEVHIFPKGRLKDIIWSEVHISLSNYKKMSFEVKCIVA